MCPEWRNDYTAFRDWALAHGYHDDLSIDRIDNYKGTRPASRWATAKEQANNKRNSKKPSRERSATVIKSCSTCARHHRLRRMCRQLGADLPKPALAAHPPYTRPSPMLRATFVTSVATVSEYISQPARMGGTTLNWRDFIDLPSSVSWSSPRSSRCCGCAT